MGRDPEILYIQTVVRSYCTHPDCVFCGRQFFKWYAGRMQQMDLVQKGMNSSFSDAAATSIKPAR